MENIKREMNADHQTNTYIAEDGLEHCAICGGALEKRIDPPLFGVIYKRRATCKCREERQKEAEAEAIAKQHAILTNAYRSACFHEKRMLQWTFNNSNCSTEAMMVARHYADNWEQMKQDNVGLLLWGGVGTGKTYMASCIANALIDKEVRVLMTDFVTISNLSVFDSVEYVDSLSRYDLLIIDDYGAERSTEFALQNVFDVINRRYESGKPLIVTTNLIPTQLMNKYKDDPARLRIYDRINEMCTPVEVGGYSKRPAYAQNKQNILTAAIERAN